MIHRLYVVLDRLAGQCGPIFQAVNDQVAARQYRGLLQQVTPVDKDEYRLNCVGLFNDETMEVEAVPPTEIIVSMKQLQLGMEANNG